MRSSSYKKYFIRQQGQSDCGVACLASVIKYYGGEMRLERLREISGTSKKGTTLLGLYQGAQAVGFEAQGCEATMEDLREQKEPCILHVIKEERLQHYVIYYGIDKKGKLIISDPAEGVKTMTESELGEIWKTKRLLLLSPTETFAKNTIQTKEKWKWLKELVREDINILTTAILIGIFLSVLGLATAIFSKVLIDDVLPSNDPRQLWSYLVLLGFVLLFRTGISAVRGTLILRQSVGFNKRIINYFYSSLIHLPQPFFDNRNTGEFMARMGDTGRIQQTITATLGGILINSMNMVVAGIAIFYYSTPLGLVALIYIPFYITFTYFYHKPIVEGQREVMKAHANNQSNYIDTIQGISVIKTNNKQTVFNDLTQAIYGFLQQKVYDLGMIRIKFGIVVQVCGVVLSMSIIGWSASMVLNKTMLLGEMMAILQMIGMFSGAIGGLAGSYVTIQEAKVAFDRMMEFTTIAPEHIPEIEAKKEPLGNFETLVAKQLSFRFVGRAPLLKDISFHLTKGEMVALLGESGCGKSTLLGILQKFQQYEGGNISVNGRPWGSLSTVEWRNSIGVVPQQIELFNSTLLENITLGDTSISPKEVIEFCEREGFGKYFRQFPQGYLTVLGEEGTNISGGQRQLVGLARALFKKPQILLLDEATSAMDRNTELFILDILKRIKKEVAILLVTHRLKTSRHADKIYVIKDGYIQAEGQHADLLKTENLYSEYWHDLIP